MDETEMKERNEQPPPEEEGEAETSFNDDRDEETNELEIETNKVRWEDDRDNYNKFKKKLNIRIGVEERKKTNIKKKFFLIWVTNLEKVTEKNPKNFSTC